ncbi:MAG TPA: hypothetical protein VEX67_12895 [Solirubrobacteraceae bacterium]|nr:hypothetical protein [Solirubrobacteraceae bacterium]
MVERERLEGRWVHSHEEDTDDEMVFRSASSGYQFPRSRGREALELNADGSYGGTAPGPTDKPEATAGGEWTIEDGNKLVLGDRTLEITAAEGDVLRVRKR